MTWAQAEVLRGIDSFQNALNLLLFYMHQLSPTLEICFQSNFDFHDFMLFV